MVSYKRLVKKYPSRKRKPSTTKRKVKRLRQTRSRPKSRISRLSRVSRKRRKGKAGMMKCLSGLCKQGADLSPNSPKLQPTNQLVDNDSLEAQINELSDEFSDLKDEQDKVQALFHNPPQYVLESPTRRRRITERKEQRNKTRRAMNVLPNSVIQLVEANRLLELSNENIASEISEHEEKALEKNRNGNKKGALFELSLKKQKEAKIKSNNRIIRSNLRKIQYLK